MRAKLGRIQRDNGLGRARARWVRAELALRLLRREHQRRPSEATRLALDAARSREEAAHRAYDLAFSQRTTQGGPA